MRGTGHSLATLTLFRIALDTSGMTEQPVILYDTTLRDGTQGENITLSLADKLRVARMLDEYGFPFIEGGGRAPNSKDIEFFAAARTVRWEHAKLAAFGSTRHRANKAGDDPNLRELVAALDPGRHDLRQELAAPRDRGPRCHAGREPGHDRGLDPGSSWRPRARGGLRRLRHAFFDGYRADRDYASRRSGRHGTPGALDVVLATNGGTLTDELVRIL